RRVEEVLSLRPEIVRKGNAVSHQIDNTKRLFFRTLHTRFFEGSEEITDQFFMGLLPQIVLVIPLRLLDVEAGSGLVYAFQRKLLYEFLHRKDFLLSARIPAEEGQKIYEGFRKIACLFVSYGHFPRLRILPCQREYREPKTVGVALTQFSVAIGLKEQRQVRELGHVLLPTEIPVKQNVKRS